MHTRLPATIKRYAAPGSPYEERSKAVIGNDGPQVARLLAPVAEVLSALRDDIAAGRLATVTELIHADFFSDFQLRPY